MVSDIMLLYIDMDHLYTQGVYIYTCIAAQLYNIIVRLIIIEHLSVLLDM